MEVLGRTNDFERSTGIHRGKFSDGPGSDIPRDETDIVARTAPHNLGSFIVGELAWTPAHNIPLACYATVFQSQWFLFARQGSFLAREVHELNGSSRRMPSCHNSINMPD
jgi:hypothetical protein